MITTKSAVCMGWVVKASRHLKRTRMVRGREQTYEKEEVKAVSDLFVVFDAAEKFLELFRKDNVPQQWERAWVASVDGHEQ